MAPCHGTEVGGGSVRRGSMWEAAAELGWHEEGERGREGVGLAHRQGWRTGWSAGRRAEGWHDGLG
jgi:hypothetical protein